MEKLSVVIGIFLAALSGGSTQAYETEEQMTTIQGSIPIAGIREFTFPPVNLSKSDPDRMASLRSAIELIKNPPSAADQAAQLAKQRSVEAHTVFKADGKIVAVQWQDGTTTFPEGKPDGGASERAKAAAAGKGLFGPDANDLVADAMTEALKQKYGSGLTIEQFETGTAPTRGDLRTEMFGGIDTRTGSLLPLTAPVVFDSDFLAVLQGYRDN